MAYQAVQGVYWGHVRRSDPEDMAIDADGEKVAFIFQVPKTGTLGKFGFLLDTVTTGDTLKVSFQDVDVTSGEPDGVADQYRTVVVADGDDQAWKLTGLVTSDGTDGGTKRSVTRGDWLAVVIEYNSYVAGNMQIRAGSASANDTFNNQQHPLLYIASWTKQNSLPVLALLYDDDSLAFMENVVPASLLSVTSSLSTFSTPDEVGLYFSNPIPCEVNGAWVAADIDADAQLLLYDSDGSSVLATGTFDTNIRRGGGVGNALARFSSEVTLAKDTNYRLILKPTTTTSVSIRYWEVDVASYFGQAVGGTAWHWTSRTDAGSWTEITTRRPYMGLSVSALDDGVGGAGGGLVSRAATRGVA